MKPILNDRFVVAVLAVACLTIVLLTVAPIRSGSPGAGEYDPWLDWNDDSKIDMKDVSRVARAFGTSGQNVSKASLAYDSGWLDLRNETGETYTITHNLNDTELQVDARREIISGWNKTYGRTVDDWAFALVQTSDGGYALAGTTGGDFWLVKTDADGNMQWNRTYGGTNNEWAEALVQTTDGGYALAGSTESFGTGVTDFWLVKTDAAGTMMWNRTYGGTFYDEAYSLVQTGDGGYALAGYTGFLDGPCDFWLVKTYANGTMMWNRTYGGTNNEWAEALVQTTDGGYALAGYTGSPLVFDRDFWLVKTDANGTMMWERTYGGTDYDNAYALIQTSDDGYALAGYTQSFGAGSPDFWLVKTDATGTMMWNRTYGGTYCDDLAYALAQTSDGGYALAGVRGSFGTGSDDFWLVKTDAAGTMMWNRTYGGWSTDQSFALVLTGDDGYALAGWTSSFGAGNYDFWLVKTDASGNIGGVESGLAWTYSSANTVTLYRGATDTSWNYVRVRLWKPR